MLTRSMMVSTACVVCIICFTVATRGAESEHGEPARLVAQVLTIDGVITDAAGEAFNLKANDGSAQRFTVNVDTLYTQDGIASTKEKTLKVGNNVSVTHKGQVAMTVVGD